MTEQWRGPIVLDAARALELRYVLRVMSRYGLDDHAVYQVISNRLRDKTERIEEAVLLAECTRR